MPTAPARHLQLLFYVEPDVVGLVCDLGERHPPGWHTMTPKQRHQWEDDWRKGAQRELEALAAANPPVPPDAVTPWTNFALLAAVARKEWGDPDRWTRQGAHNLPADVLTDGGRRRDIAAGIVEKRGGAGRPPMANPTREALRKRDARAKQAKRAQLP